MQTQQAPAHPSARTATAPVVAVVATTPETVLDDFARAMDLAGASEFLPDGQPDALEGQHLLAALVSRLLHHPVAD